MSDFDRYVLSAMKYFMVEIYLITLKVVLYKKDHIWKVNIVSWSINLISSMTKTIFQVTSWRKEQEIRCNYSVQGNLYLTLTLKVKSNIKYNN